MVNEPIKSVLLFIWFIIFHKLRFHSIKMTCERGVSVWHLWTIKSTLSRRFLQNKSATRAGLSTITIWPVRYENLKSNLAYTMVVNTHPERSTIFDLAGGLISCVSINVEFKSSRTFYTRCNFMCICKWFTYIIFPRQLIDMYLSCLDAFMCSW
jgi:hypothetical protein